jgi:hypothetical protein
VDILCLKRAQIFCEREGREMRGYFGGIGFAKGLQHGFSNGLAAARHQIQARLGSPRASFPRSPAKDFRGVRHEFVASSVADGQEVAS